MRSCCIAVALLLAVGMQPTAAQNTGDGSIYSAFGLGELTSFGSSQSRAMGGGGYALRSLNYVNFDNPATLSYQVLTRFVAGVDYQGVEIRDAQDNVSRLNQGSLAGVHLSFPLLQRRLGLGVGIEPYSRVSYRIRREGMIAEPDTIMYGVDSEGRGGLQRIGGSVGYQVTPNLALGARLGYVFGILETGRRTFFVGGEHRNIEVMNQTRLGGLDAALGMHLTFAGPAAGSDEIMAGATFSLPTTLSGDRVRTLGLSLDRDTLGTLVEGDVSIPWSIDAGVAYILDDRWSFVLDGSYAPWSDFESTFAFNGYEPGASYMRDRLRVSAGGEFTPGGLDPLTTFLRQTSYRLGAYMDRSYVDPSESYELITYALTTGVSLPTFFSGTRLDVDMEVGTRGTTNHGLVRDVFYRVSASVNIGERWFERRRLR